MNVLKPLIVSALSMLALASAANAETAEDVASRVGKEIVLQQETTVTNLRVVYEEGRAILIAMSEQGATQPQLVRAANRIVSSMRNLADRGLDRVEEIRANGIATLERIGAAPRLMALVNEAATTAIKRVDRETSGFVHGIRDLVERLG